MVFRQKNLATLVESPWCAHSKQRKSDSQGYIWSTELVRQPSVLYQPLRIIKCHNI